MDDLYMYYQHLWKVTLLFEFVRWMWKTNKLEKVIEVRSCILFLFLGIFPLVYDDLYYLH